jgi:hypothetical protein
MKIRNKNENIQFIKHIENATDELRQAIDSITYISYPEVNQRTITTINKAIDILENVLRNCIFKP